MTGIAVLVAVAAGVVSFASPCLLPLVPVYVSYLLGTAPTGRPAAATRQNVALRHALVFVAGFTTVFVTVWASLGFVGYLLRDHAAQLRVAGGAVLIVFGLHVAGLIEISALYRDARPLQRLTRPVPDGATPGPRYWHSLILGIAFAAGWTPCIGPVLGGIIGLASASPTALDGTLLLLAYALGLGIPFVLVAVGATEVSRRLGWLRRHQRGVDLVTGAVLVGGGFLLITNHFATLSRALAALGR
jgi:cytochrome c-type biogenesis protein